MKKFIISRNDDLYQAWPDVALTAAGRLACVWSQCTHHGDRSYSRIVVAHSDDCGRSWSEPRPVTEALHKTVPSDPHWNCARIVQLQDGRLGVVVDRIGGRDEGNEREGEQSNWLYFSEDAGETWSAAVATPAVGIVPDRLVELCGTAHAGRWLLSAHTQIQDVWTVRTWISDDRGASWDGPHTVAAVPELMLCEETLFELPGGEVCCLMRENSRRGLDAFKTVSRDGGRSWGPVAAIALPGCHRPVGGLLQSGRIFVTYRFCQWGAGWVGWWTQNFFGAFTDVESCLAEQREQTKTRIFPLDYDRSPVAHTGYSGWVQFPDGEIYVVNYIVDDAPKGHIRGYALREEEFVLGE